jgi:putative ABC transport system permease protein
MVTALVIAAVPFAQAVRRRSVADALRQGNGGMMTSRDEHRVRNVLVVAQVAIACTMLVGAGLIGRSLIELARVDVGIDVRNVVTARLTLSFTKYNSPQASRLFAEAVLERLQSLPGVSAAGLASTLPLANANTQDVRFRIEGVTGTARIGQPHSDATAVSPGYFRAVGIPLVRGRDFAAADRDTSSPPVAVSQRLARTYWGARDPIGTRISPDSGRHWMTVVGVVGDVRMAGLDKDVTDEIYLPVAASGSTDFRVFLRTTGAVAPVVKALRAAVHEVDAYQPVSSVETLEQVRGAALAEPRLTTTLLTLFAVVSLVLTATGLGGVIAYQVAGRIPEIAVRLALGSSAGRVLFLVMQQGMVIVATGLLVGFAIALEASRLATKLLFQTAPTDVGTYAAVGIMVLTTAAVACYLPSRRALHTDPTQVFRAG